MPEPVDDGEKKLGLKDRAKAKLSEGIPPIGRNKTPGAGGIYDFEDEDEEAEGEAKEKEGQPAEMEDVQLLESPKKEGSATKVLGMGRSMARRASVAAATSVSSKMDSIEQTEYDDNDLRAVLRNKMIAGRDNIQNMVSQSLTVTAPDLKSMEMWKAALQPLLQAQVKYRTRYPLVASAGEEDEGVEEQAPEPATEPEPVEPEPEAVEPEPEPDAAAHEKGSGGESESEDEEDEFPEPPKGDLSAWEGVYAVVYKTQLVFCSCEGGEVRLSLPMWTVLPTSIEISFDPQVGGAAVLSFATSDGATHFIDCLESATATTMMSSLRGPQNQRGDSEHVDAFIKAEVTNLSSPSAVRLPRPRSPTLAVFRTVACAHGGAGGHQEGARRRQPPGRSRRLAQQQGGWSWRW